MSTSTSTSMTDHHLGRISAHMSSLGCIVFPLFVGLGCGTLVSLMEIASSLRDIAEDMHQQTVVTQGTPALACDECDCEPASAP